MNLSQRLRAVAALVPPASRVADIGTGHGLLPLWLLARSRVTHCIATEKTPETGPDLPRLPAFPELEVRFGDGLEALHAGDRLDVLILSGLGARTILRILEENPSAVSGVPRLVLQPQTEAGRLRRWLVEHGRPIVAEHMVLDRGRFYVAIAAGTGRARIPSHETLDAYELLEAGPCLVSSGNPLVRSYWRRTLSRLDRILERGRRSGGTARARRQRALAARVLEAIDAGRTRG